MPSCVTCSKEIEGNVRNCPSCGTPVELLSSGNSSMTAATVATSFTERPVSRTTGSSKISAISIVEDEGRFLPGSIVAGRYRILSMLGKGGMGEVYRATDLTLAQSVALKFLPEEAARNERWLERFHSEVRIARQISHPNICRVYDIGETDGTPFISMEYVDGDDLSGLLGSIGRLPPDKALETARKLCAGLAAAHDKGVIHRDLKPQNIMISKRGEIVIMDFGLAAVADSLGGPEARNGTPAYMAPEQLRGAEVTAKSDIYALGLVLYELFTGKKPFEAKTIPELIQLQESQSSVTMTSIAADIDPAVEKIIQRCLHPDPAMRPSSPLAVAAALPGGDPLAAALAAGETISPEMLAVAGKREPIPFRYTFPALLAVLAAVFAVSFIGQKIYAVNYANATMSPEVLAQKARDNAAAFGYTERAGDSHSQLVHPGEFFAWLYRNRKGKTSDWAAAFRAEPPFRLRYRQSPGLLIAAPDGQVTADRPAPNQPGMWTMDVDAAGHLRSFQAVPPQFLEKPLSSSDADASAVFRAAGFDIAQFTEATPQWTPPSAFDLRRSWKGKHPHFSEMSLGVDIAWFQGRLVNFSIVWPWTKPANTLATQNEGQTGKLWRTLSLAAGLIACFWLARRNLQFGRGDKRGALRIAMAYVVFQFLQLPNAVHWVPHTASFGFFTENAGILVFYAGLCWLLYVALEPMVRARWPHSILSWSRVLAGNFNDPLVGAHALYGALAGVFISAVFLAVVYYEVAQGGRPNAVSLDGATGSRAWLADLASRLSGALTTGMTSIFLMFGLRRIFRYDWLTTLIAASFFTLIQMSQSDSEWWMSIVWLFIYAVLLFSLIRIGMVACAVAVFCANCLLNLPATVDPQIWYAAPGYLQLALVAVVACGGFWISRGDHIIDPGKPAATT